jgi:hypothetical protein
MVAHACNTSTWEDDEFKARFGYTASPSHFLNKSRILLKKKKYKCGMETTTTK